MATIPASQIVAVTPGVISAGGNALNLIGLILTTGTRVPIGAVQSFASASAVASYFGPTSKEASLASIYFGGFSGSTVQPGSVLFAQYPLNAVSAFERGGNISSLSLAALQAISGTLTITVDGYVRTATIALNSATSFSNAASSIQTSLNTSLPQQATGTGSISGSTLTVTSVSGNTIAVGQTVTGTGVAASTIILAQLTGTPNGTGTYTVSGTQTALSESLTFTATALGVTYDAVAGAFVITSGISGAPSTITFGTGAAATSLLLTQITGAVLSQGAVAASPISFMNSVLAVTQNWATFMLEFDPDQGVGNAQKLLFAQWTNSQNSRYMFVCWDTDSSPTSTVPATASLGYLINTVNTFAGTFLVYDPNSSGGIAAFVCGIAASTNFSVPNGRTAFAFRSQSGLVAGVTNQTNATNLLANGYNFYGAYGTANQNFVFLYSGQVSGPFVWADSFVNQIWLNNQFQLFLLTFLTTVGSIPYNNAGNAQIEAALASPISAGLSFGAFRAGVALSAAQISAVNTQANANIATTLQQQGWYLQVLPASSQVRVARQSPPCTFFYMDGQSIQQINLASLELQ